MKKPKIKKITIREKHFKTFIHINFILGILYAFYHFIRTPKSVDMATRRMWAYETWIIFTLYSIFIYLFSIEVASQEGEPILNRLFKIKRYVDLGEISLNSEEIFNYFKENPQKYASPTHKGITVLEGDLQEKGAVFETREKFLPFIPLFLRLRFKTVEVKDNTFQFKLTRPLGFLEIRGAFSVKEQAESKRLYLEISSKEEGFWKHLLLAGMFIFPMRPLIGKQLKRELVNIRRELNSMEASTV